MTADEKKRSKFKKTAAGKARRAIASYQQMQGRKKKKLSGTSRASDTDRRATTIARGVGRQYVFEGKGPTGKKHQSGLKERRRGLP